MLHLRNHTNVLTWYSAKLTLVGGQIVVIKMPNTSIFVETHQSVVILIVVEYSKHYCLERRKQTQSNQLVWETDPHWCSDMSFTEQDTLALLQWREDWDAAEWIWGLRRSGKSLTVRSVINALQASNTWELLQKMVWNVSWIS